MHILWSKEVAILFLQKVTTDQLHDILGYIKTANVTKRRNTKLIIQDGLPISNLDRLQS